jgi:DUF1365 family protein
LPSASRPEPAIHSREIPVPAASFSSIDSAVRAMPGATSLPAFDAVADGCALVHGIVAHTRHRPTVNAFRYPAFCLRLPLSQLATLDACGVAHNRRGAVSFHDRDHGARDGSMLLPWIRALLAAEDIAAEGEVVLHAFPRMLGYVFNPIAFWVCHDRAGAVRAVLCEVSNTFGEHHNYLLAHADGRPLVSGESLTARKVFHVSPFCAVQGHYVFRFHFGAERWLARIDYHDGASGDSAPTPLLATSVSGRVAPLNRHQVRGLPWRYRFFTFGVVARIHWQALKLWCKGLHVFRKPDPPATMTSR